MATLPDLLLGSVFLSFVLDILSALPHTIVNR